MTAFYFRASSVDVVDGDTVDVELDIGLGLTWRGRLRLSGLNAPETHSRRPLEKRAGQVVARMVLDWLKRPLSPTHARWVRSASKPEKYGRLLGDVVEVDAAGNVGENGQVFPVLVDSLATHLLRARAVKAYHGEAKPVWTDDELAAIVAAE